MLELDKDVRIIIITIFHMFKKVEESLSILNRDTLRNKKYNG